MWRKRGLPAGGAALFRSDATKEAEIIVSSPYAWQSSVMADDERLPFVTAQRAGREGPDLMQLLDVVGVDLIEGAVAGARVVLAGQRPLVIVALPRYQILIRHHRPRQPQR